MEDIHATGALFTWSNKQEPVDRVYSTLDKAMGNLEWMEVFGDYMAYFHPPSLFDHAPCTISDMRSGMSGKRSFKYFNMWEQSELFKDCVINVWQRRHSDTKMFQVIKKLKELKHVLKNLNKTCISDIETSYSLNGVLLEKIQNELVDNPGNTDFMQQEYDVAHELKELLTVIDNFLIQKAQIQWSLEGTLILHTSIIL
ncbi:uncharacterized protein LOC141649341 [Silene latifolia]|uniref:uncharacterized protein LOC141649341 n=1 Tax=Silene latifolia TaxID=37657 RepID=UPI003D784005